LKLHIYGNVGLVPEVITFYGGEPHVKNVPEIQYLPCIIDARVTCSEDFMRLLVLTDAVRRQNPREIHLFIPYFPGARQDRAQRGEALTAKVYADIINAQKYDSVTVVDPHSDVVPALVERCHVIPMAAAGFDFFSPDEEAIAGLICPDAGAEKRTHALAKAIGCDRIVFGRKHRDVSTGELNGFSIDPLQPNDGGRWVIADDICDGGRTFIGIAEALAETGTYPDRLDLWVTHGIFSHGTEKIKNTFYRIGTTDSFGGDGSDGNLYRYSLESLVLPEIKRSIGWIN
jgi:ribose-phosphate pyrophosphokinase